MSEHLDEFAFHGILRAMLSNALTDALLDSSTTPIREQAVTWLSSHEFYKLYNISGIMVYNKCLDNIKAIGAPYYLEEDDRRPRKPPKYIDITDDDYIRIDKSGNVIWHNKKLHNIFAKRGDAYGR